MREDGQTDNRVPCRGAMSVSREEIGFQQVWPLEKETLALCKCGGSRKPFQCTCFLQAVLQALAWLLSVPPWGGGGVSLEAGPEGP